MKTRQLKCVAGALGSVLLCMVAVHAVAQTDADPVLSPDAVAPDPALSPEEMHEPPIPEAGSNPTDPALSPEEMTESPVRSPDATVPDPALSPEQMSEPPIPEAN